jgi:hypothetical protein
MKYILLASFVNQLVFFSKSTQNKFYKQLQLLLKDLRHPSLRAKKYDIRRGLWQARIDRKIRFYFFIEEDAYIF